MDGEEDLLAGLRRRDPEAQRRLLARERPRAARVVAAIIGGGRDCDTLVNDLLTDFLFHYVDTLREAGAISAYVRIMAVRRSRRHLARARQQEELDTAQLPDHAAAPVDERASTSRLLPQLHACLDHLSDRARAILRLHFGHGQSYADIAAQMGRTKQAVGKTIDKSLRALRACLEEGTRWAT